MFQTKKWGMVTGPELYMLNHAERHRKQIARKKAKFSRRPVKHERENKSEV